MARESDEMFHDEAPLTYRGHRIIWDDDREAWVALPDDARAPRRHGACWAELKEKLDESS